jgi:hypothetical protein
MTNTQTVPSRELPQEETEGQTSIPNKFIYPEFAGWKGERLLDSILRKILPLALHRTWEILVDRQAQGNDCFLSIAKIAEVAERGERTIRLNIHELEARKLLVLRPEQKLFREADGSCKLKFVVVKDFSGLYDLALEYLRWTESDAYIPPEREFAKVIQSNEALTRKLIRFNNYRRVIENSAPGPKPLPREEHRRFTEYDPKLDEQGAGVSGGTCTLQHVKDVVEQSTSADRKQYLQDFLQDDLKKDSKKRVKTSNQKNSPYGDSFDSEGPQKAGGCGYTKDPTVQRTETGTEEDSHYEHTKTKTNPTTPLSLSSEENRAGTEQSARRERAEAFVQRAMAAYAATQGESGQHGQRVSKVKPNALVSSFTRMVSPLFRDQNLKGSLTRALRTVEQRSLSQRDILACLVKAYIVTLETKQVRQKYRRPDGDIKMPLFCTMFDRFVHDCAAGSVRFTNEHLARDIAADDRLVLFLVEHDLERLLLDGGATSDVKEELEGEEEQDAAWQMESFSEEDALPPARAEDAQSVSASAEQAAQDCLPVAHPDEGWSSWSEADRWGDQLREHYPYGRNDYGYDVLPVCYDGEPTGKWAFIFYKHRGKQHCWATYVSSDQVKCHLNSDETEWVAYDGVIGSTDPAH